MMRKAATSGIIALILLAFFLSGAGEMGFIRHRSLPFSPTVAGIDPQRDVPAGENKSFVVVIYAHNAANWCERLLHSVFSQDYENYRVLFVDDASVDGTLEKAQLSIVESRQDHRVIAIRNEKLLGPVGSLYRAADKCQDQEIVIWLDAANWLSHESVLNKLNSAFQNPDVWIAFSPAIEYPSYRVSPLPAVNQPVTAKRGWREIADDSPPIAFYAGLFKAIHLPDLLANGQFAETNRSFLIPLLEQAGGRCREIKEPLVFDNLATKKRQLPSQSQEISLIQKREPYRPLSQFPKTPLKPGAIDIVLFSFDRPLQLFGALESIQRYVSGYQTLTVLYRASDERFNAAYDTVKSAFPNVRYVKQSENPRKDFKPLLTQAIFDTSADYIAFGVDDMILKDFVDLQFCRQMVEKTGAYGFYLRFGRHIHESYMFKKPIPVPPSVPLMNGVFAWDFRQGECDWDFPNSVDLTLYRKADIKAIFSALKFKTPNSLEFNWAQHPPANTLGLYFEHSKMVNLPLNIVNPSDCPHMNFMTAEELLVKFNQGFKIDIDPLFQVDNPSPHYEYIPEFIPR